MAREAPKWLLDVAELGVLEPTLPTLPIQVLQITNMQQQKQQAASAPVANSCTIWAAAAIGLAPIGPGLIRNLSFEPGLFRCWSLLVVLDDRKARAWLTQSRKTL